MQTSDSSRVTHSLATSCFIVADVRAAAATPRAHLQQDRGHAYEQTSIGWRARVDTSRQQSQAGPKAPPTSRLRSISPRPPEPKVAGSNPAWRTEGVRKYPARADLRHSPTWSGRGPRPVDPVPAFATARSSSSSTLRPSGAVPIQPHSRRDFATSIWSRASARSSLGI